MNAQGVGPNYKKEEYHAAQRIGWQILDTFKDQIKPGMTEKDARKVHAEVIKKFGVEKNWHPPKIRFGPNSIKSFSEASDEDYQLKEKDIFFVDLGPIVNGYEADIGKTFTNNPAQQKIITDGEEIFALTKKAFYENKMKGAELYTYAEKMAAERGWQLVGEGANGHRIGDFPHHVFHRGSLREFDEEIIPDLWILEIQLLSPDLTYGAFFEDVL